MRLEDLFLQLYKAQHFRCYRSGPRRLLGEYGGIEADQEQQQAADSSSWLWLSSSSSRLIEVDRHR
jgi:hypothetical protein